MADDKAGPALFRFGVFELDLRAAEIRKQGLRIRLRGRPYEILNILIDRPGDLVSRDELRERLWAADTFVDFDHGLNAAVNKLREVLGDSADNPRFIETVPRRGYRFIAPVARVARGATSGAPTVAAPPGAVEAISERREEDVLPDLAVPASPPPAPGPGVTPAAPVASPPPPRSVPWATLLAVVLALGLAAFLALRRGPAAPPAGLVRLAVLPFQNLSGDPGREYFVDGMTDALIAELAQVGALRVISRTSVMAYKTTQKALPQIAKELNVDVVVEGSAVVTGGRARITAQLIDAASDRHLWARSYECDPGDILDVQRRVAQEITREVKVAVTTQEDERLHRSSPVEPRAHEAFLRGRAWRARWTTEGIRKAADYFREAIAIDPRYAEAHAALADAYWLMGSAGFEVRPAGETGPLAKAAAARALELDPSLPSARVVEAMVMLDHDWSFAEGEARIKRVIEQNPSYGEAMLDYSGFLASMGRAEEAVAAAQRALELDPLSTTAGQTLGWRFLYAGRCPRALPEFAKTLELDPVAYVARVGLGLCQWRAGAPEAVAELERAARDADESAWPLAVLGHARAARGEVAAARSILARLEDAGRRGYVSPIYRAFVLAGLGDKDQAFLSLDASYAERSPWMLFLPVEPELQNLRSDPRFDHLLRRMGHPLGRRG
jgi:TolB-like protein/DNA-binding winged helix-turn-helix (wHTH) protein/Tfp pilus assembly protein PilF